MVNIRCDNGCYFIDLLLLLHCYLIWLADDIHRYNAYALCRSNAVVVTRDLHRSHRHPLVKFFILDGAINCLSASVCSLHFALGLIGAIQYIVFNSF